MIDGHGDDLYKYEQPIAVNFSSNLTNWLDHSPLVHYLNDHIDQSISSYPEPMPYSLEAQLANLHTISPAEVCVTNGATEAIYLIAQSFAGAQSAVLQPTFTEYADACRINKHSVTSLYSLPEPGQLPEKIQMLWLCNPNNPTGTVIPKEKLLRLIESHPEVLFIIDQSYEAFTQQPVLSAHEAAQYPHVFIIHSLTKRYGIPGLRLGYLTGNTELLNHLRTHRMPWSVNGVALRAGQYIVQHPQDFPFDLTRCLLETQRFQTNLRATGMLEVWDTDTHFMLIRLRMGKAAALKSYLAQKHGLLIRDASNFEGLDPSYFRISTQQPADNDKLVHAIQAWFEE